MLIRTEGDTEFAAHDMHPNRKHEHPVSYLPMSHLDQHGVSWRVFDLPWNDPCFAHRSRQIKGSPPTDRKALPLCISVGPVFAIVNVPESFNIRFAILGAIRSGMTDYDARVTAVIATMGVA